MPAILTERLAGSGPAAPAGTVMGVEGPAPGAGPGGPVDPGRSAPSGSDVREPLSSRRGRLPSGRPARHRVTDS